MHAGSKWKKPHHADGEGIQDYCPGLACINERIYFAAFAVDKRQTQIVHRKVQLRCRYRDDA